MHETQRVNPTDTVRRKLSSFTESLHGANERGEAQERHNCTLLVLIHRFVHTSEQFNPISSNKRNSDYIPYSVQ